MVHWCHCFSCSFPCLYLYNNCLTSLFIICFVKSSTCFMIESISCFKWVRTSIGKLKWKFLGSAVVASLLSRIILNNWLNCCKVFWLFYCVDTKDIVFVWFIFLVSMNSFQHLFVLTILEAWLIVCLELRIWFQFSFYFEDLNSLFQL